MRSTRGGVRLKLESGPDGIAMAEDGTLRWAPTGSGEVSVIVRVTDASAQEALADP